MNIQNDENLNVVIVGHVDHGKSTIIGRLLSDLNVLPKGKLEQIRKNCEQNSKPFEYAFLLDALKIEQAQGITLDTARCFFSTAKRKYIIIDAPGHIEFLKNMVTGASRAQAALLVIDASRGVEENTRRHGYFLSMLGIRQVTVVVNKMDLVEFKEQKFNDIKQEYEIFLGKINIKPEAFIPVSGYFGDNIVNPSDNISWYNGPTVIEQLDSFNTIPSADKLPFRMPVQGVYKFTESNDSRRIIAGMVESGKIMAGDKVVFYPSGKRTKIKTLETFPDTLEKEASSLYYSAGMAAGYTMSEQIFVRRGEIACLENETPPCVGVKIKTNLFWLGKNRFVSGKIYHIKCGTAKVEMRLEKIERIINASNLSCLMRNYVEKNEVAECVISLEAPIAFDVAGSIDQTSRFVVVDDYEIAGGGIIIENMESYDYDTRNIRWSENSVSENERLRCLGQKGIVVWMTGLSGSGKTTIAQEVERRLIVSGYSSYILDGDKLRRGLNKDLGFSDVDRIENMRRVMETANLFRDAGIITLVTLISPFEKNRLEARKTIGENFTEVYIKASLETCKKRDPKKLYQKAQSGQIENFTGIDSPYEIPDNPDLILDTEKWNEVECAETLFEYIMKQIKTNEENL